MIIFTRIRQFVVGAAALGLVGGAFAQPLQGQAAEPDTADVRQQLEAKQQEIQSLSAQLQQIQQEAMEANPELVERQDDFRELVFETMAGDGYQPQAAIEEMQAMQESLETGELSEEERQKLMNELQQENQEFRLAQREAMQDEEVRTFQQSLQEDVIAAMKAQSDETESLIAQLNTAQQEFQAMIQAAMQSQGQTQ